MVKKSRGKGAAASQSGIVSLMLVLMLSMALSSIIFGLMELGVPYMRLKKNAELRDKAFQAAGYCRDLAVAHVYENANFDIAFAERLISELFTGIDVPLKNASSLGVSLVCDISDIKKISVSPDGTMSFSIWAKGELPDVQETRFTKTEIVFDRYMRILSRKTVEVQK